MNREDFNLSVERVFAFYAVPKDEDGIQNFKRYVDALYENLARIRVDQFEAVCKKLVGELNPMKRPMASDFWRVYNGLMEELRRHSDESGACRDETPEEKEAWCVAEIEKHFTPTKARHVLELVERGKHRVSQSVMDRLLEIAGQETPDV